MVDFSVLRIVKKSLFGRVLLQTPYSCHFLQWCKYLLFLFKSNHLRVTALDRKGNISKAFSRMKKLLAILEKNLKFERDSRFGYLTFDPAGDVIKSFIWFFCLFVKLFLTAVSIPWNGFWNFTFLVPNHSSIHPPTHPLLLTVFTQF